MNSPSPGALGQFIGPASAPEPATCNGLAPTTGCTVNGVRNQLCQVVNDTIIGTNKRDVIVGSGGNDTISGGNDDDLICGGSSNDTPRGNNGDDALDGGGGTDTCNGGSGADGAVGCETVAGVP